MTETVEIPTSADLALFDGFTTYQQARAFSPNTLDRRRLALGRFALFMSPASVLVATSADVDDWLSRLNSARTRHAYRSDLRVFFRWALRRGLADHDPVLGTDSVRVPKALPKPVPAEVLAEAFRIATGRVQLALLLGALAGLRVGEMATLDSGDLHLDSEPPILVVRGGKGGKDRVVPVHPTLLPFLRGHSGWLFGSAHGRGHVEPKSLAWQVSRTLSKAGGQRYTTHQLRHFFGTEAARWSGGNVVLVAALMGHANTNTTMGYIGWSPAEGAEVVGKITAGPADDELAQRRRRQIGA